MQAKLFVTGTDTDAGKTYVSTGLLKAFNQRGLTTLGIKPIASGCFSIKNKLYNNDAMSLQQASSIKLDYDKINPYAFEPAIAPHIAADQNHCELNLQSLNLKLQDALNYPANICIIEGVGGWQVPLNQTETIADFVIQHNFKTLLIVGIKLGCLNHAILTVKAMQHDGAQIIGWIANCIDQNMSHINENISTLQKWLPIPFLGTLNHHACVTEAIDIDTLSIFLHDGGIAG